MMKTAPSDRELVIDRIWRRMTQEERLALQGEMNADVRSLLCTFIVNLFPAASLEERKFRYVQARHGEAIAKRLRSWLKRPQNHRARERWHKHDSGFSAALQEVDACRKAVDRHSEGPRLA